MSHTSLNQDYVNSAVLHKIRLLTYKLKKRMTEILDIRTGDRVVDVGCVPGIDTVEGSARGRNGPRRRDRRRQGDDCGGRGASVESRCRDRTRHKTADAASIPYEAGFFNASRSERLFQHVPHAATVLREMVRVTRSGGRIAVADSDWGTLSIDTTEVDIERRIRRIAFQA